VSDLDRVHVVTRPFRPATFDCSRDPPNNRDHVWAARLQTEGELHERFAAGGALIQRWRSTHPTHADRKLASAFPQYEIVTLHHPPANPAALYQTRVASHTLCRAGPQTPPQGDEVSEFKVDSVGARFCAPTIAACVSVHHAPFYHARAETFPPREERRAPERPELTLLTLGLFGLGYALTYFAFRRAEWSSALDEKQQGSQNRLFQAACWFTIGTTLLFVVQAFIGAEGQ
jgi:hypothetical protein